MPVADLIKLNDIKDTHEISNGAIIKLPERRVLQEGEYVVQSGDNLTKIARANGTTVAKILEENPEITNRNLIIDGQVIRIPKGTNDVAKEVAEAQMQVKENFDKAMNTLNEFAERFKNLVKEAQGEAERQALLRQEEVAKQAQEELKQIYENIGNIKEGVIGKIRNLLNKAESEIQAQERVKQLNEYVKGENNSSLIEKMKSKSENNKEQVKQGPHLGEKNGPNENIVEVKSFDEYKKEKIKQSLAERQAREEQEKAEGQTQSFRLIDKDFPKVNTLSDDEVTQLYKNLKENPEDNLEYKAKLAVAKNEYNKRQEDAVRKAQIEGRIAEIQFAKEKEMLEAERQAQAEQAYINERERIEQQANKEVADAFADYTVKSTDSVSKICSTYGLTYKEFYELNPNVDKKTNLLKTGQTVKIINKKDPTKVSKNKEEIVPWTWGGLENSAKSYSRTNAEFDKLALLAVQAKEKGYEKLAEILAWRAWDLAVRKCKC